MHARDAHWLGELPRTRAPRGRRTSSFVTTRDGARLAVDVHLPRDVGARLPTMLRQTRYMRALEARGPLLRALGAPSLFDVHRTFRERFLDAGWAWVDVDVRGTGASDGRWRSPWFEDQRRDAHDVVSWIVAQPWSDGTVGSLGISYDGTCADMLLAEPHPAVRAVAPLFSLYDTFADVAFPGGVQLSWFTEAWAAYNRALDAGRHHEAMGTPLWLMARAATTKPDRAPGEALLALLGRAPEPLARATFEALVRGLVRGVAPVDGVRAPTASMLEERAHNLDVHAGALLVTDRDDDGVDPERPELTIDSFSPHAYAEAQRASGAAIYSYSGWRDGAYPHAAVKRHLTVPSPGGRLTIGPWAHTGKLTIHAFYTGVPTAFDHAGELLAFFEQTVRGREAPSDGSPIHYFTTGEERWRRAGAWPPPGLGDATLHLAPARLTPTVPEAGRLPRPVRRDVGSGPRSRWRSLLSLVPGDYPDRRARDRELTVFDSPPLVAPFEVTGHPTLSLEIAWDRGTDARVHAYLEDVAPSGEIAYVTEGVLRARHRASRETPGAAASPAPPRSFLREDAAPLAPGEAVSLVLDLLPCSHLFASGHRVRLVLADADVDHFARTIAGDTAREVCLHVGGPRPSRLVLPCPAPPSFRAP